MTDQDPSLQHSVDEIWLEKARNDMRRRICNNLRLINSGFFTEDELVFARSARELPYVAVEDEALDKIFDSGDVDAWNRYNAIHPELSEQAERDHRLWLAQQAALDKQEVEKYPDLLPIAAIEAVIQASQTEIIDDARYFQIAMEAAAKNGFAV